KGIGIQGLDQAIFGEFFPRAPQRRTLVGSSIGSWRFASMAAHRAQQGTERLAELHTNLYFHKQMTRQEASEVCRGMLLDLVQGKGNDLVNHPDYPLGVSSSRAKHIFQSDKALPLLASVAGIVGTTGVARKDSRHFMQRVISQPNMGEQFQIPEDG